MHEWYKEMRPLQLGDIIGQEAAVKTLSAMAQQETVPHSVLFCGPPGTGKTTLARIMADVVGAKGMEVIEINMADDRGIDQVRNIRDSQVLAPMGCSARAYILDEFHSITAQAAQAFLKLLEDTPKHVYFFVCTSEPDKIPKALRTRLTTIVLKSLSTSDMKALATKAAERYNVTLDPKVLNRVIEAADGSARQLLVMLEQLAASGFDPVAVGDVLLRAKNEPDTIEAIRMIFTGGQQNFKKVHGMISVRPKDEVEGLRHFILKYAQSALGSDNERTAARSAFVIEVFSKPFYDSGMAGFLAKIYYVMNRQGV